MKVIPISKQESVPVTVNGVLISSEEIAAEAQNHPMPKGKPGWAWRAAAQALVLRQVLLQHAKAQNLQAEPIQIQSGIWETDEEALIRQIMEQHIQPSKPDVEVLRAAYEQNPNKYLGPSLFEAAHILFAARPEDLPARRAARTSANQILAQIQENPGQFANLAAENSACPSGKNGGLLGQMASGDTVPEFEAALVKMAEGEISKRPVETRYGYHIIRLDAKAQGQPLPFESVLPHLEQAYEKAQWVKNGKQLMHELAASANITGVDINDAPWLETKKKSA